MIQDTSDKKSLALVIEDDIHLANIAVKALQMAKFETEVIEDGKTAMERLAATTPDVVILDIHLPYVSGADILDQIRTDERLKNTKVIIITADLFKGKSLRREADFVLIKPLTFTQLYDLVLDLNPLTGE